MTAQFWADPWGPPALRDIEPAPPVKRREYPVSTEFPPQTDGAVKLGNLLSKEHFR